MTNIISESIFIILPHYNESFATIRNTLSEINEIQSIVDVEIEIILVDDGSTVLHDYDKIRNLPLNNIKNYYILRTEVNLGHQNAILAGLKHAQNLRNRGYVIVMDIDGEDLPSNITELYKLIKSNNVDVVVATRGKRFVKINFRIFYILFKIVTRFLTGRVINFGNFCIIKVDKISDLLKVNYSTFSLPAQIMKSNLRMLQVKIDRGRRFQGNSKMNNAKLIKYAFKFLSNFIDEIIYKIGLILILFWIVEIVSILMIIYIKFQTDLSIPGWTSLMVLLIFFSVVQLSIIYLTFILNYIKISDVSEKNQTNSVYSRIY